LFSRGGFEVVFIDVYRPLIDELNRRGNYNVIIKSDQDLVMNIKNVRGVCADDRDKVINELATAGIAAVSVGLNGLKTLFPLIAEALIERFKIDNDYPLDIIIAENMRNADAYFEQQIQPFLPVSYPFARLVGLIETSIGKMVPIMQKKDVEDDMLQIFAEPYNTLILNKRGFRNPIPGIEGLAPRDNMKAWVDRKLFIHNLGHSTAAYIGYLFNPDFNFLYQALEVREIFDFARVTMLQASEILLILYPGEFTAADLTAHIDDLLARFMNKSLGDTIFRVGCDLMRKLGPEDRLAGAIKNAIRHNLPYDKILIALVCACHFRAGDEEGKALKEDVEFCGIYNKGIESVLDHVCRFSRKDHPGVFSEASRIDEAVNKKGVRSFLEN
jgi:mannitol-1-phosphate 5-dehydrogenase